MAKPLKGNGYAVIHVFTDDGKKVASYKENDYQKLADIKTRANELNMEGLNKTGDTDRASIRGR